LLRNGLDYLAYHEYARALSFLKAVEARKDELNETELQSLKKGIAQAQQGMREAVNSPKVIAQGKGRPPAQPGSIALAKAPTDTIQRTSVDLPTAPPVRSSRSGPALPAPIAPMAVLPDPEPASTVTIAMADKPAAASTASTPLPSPPGGVDLPPLPDSSTVGLPELPSPPAQSATVDTSAIPAQSPSTVELPPAAPAPLPSGPPPPLVLESSDPAPVQVELPAVSSPAPSTAELPPVVTSPPTPMAVEPPLPQLPAADSPRAMVAQRPDPSVPPQPVMLPEAPPAAEVPPTVEPRSVPSMPAYPSASPVKPGDPEEPVLSEKLRREIEQLAQRGTGADRSPGGVQIDPNDPKGNPPTASSPRLEIARAPSPTEARPIRQIAVPEEFVPLGKREWDPNRKYWAAAGTCHMILYFQDPVLERYGQSAEQALGPWGRYFSYPLDDPKQSNQRNQILQPFYSMGKFCFQVGTLPYKLVVDPPWESEYDLGYYRPGDRIPPDTIYITPYGIGPPLKGRNY
jgi:hypothetical protein